MDNKICVYAICKNEIQFVDKWLGSMIEADYIVILDTGSTDGTFEKLKNDPRVTRVEQKIYDPWRFDNARNDALLLCPEDTDIFVSTDLDEIFDSGWSEPLREQWIRGIHVRALYKYAWSHNTKGEPERVFYYDKIHGPNWYWKAPVHEYLTSDEYDEEYTKNHSLDLFDSIFLHHYPDQSKSRGSYLPLLELRAEEDPNDYNGLYYYAHELYYRGYYEKSISVLDDILNDDRFEGIRTPLEVAACYLFMGDSFLGLNSQEAAISAYNSAIAAESTYREPYLQLAKVYLDKGYNNIAIGIVKDAIEKSYRHYTWLERDLSWKEEPYDILALAYSSIGDYKSAYTNAVKALMENTSDERLLYNAKAIGDKLNEEDK